MKGKQMETVLVLSAYRYEFTDENTGVVRRGVSLHYISDYREDTEASVGFKPIKAPVSLEVFEAVKKGGAPALYRLTSKSKPGAQGRPTLTVIKAEFLKPVKIFEQS